MKNICPVCLSTAVTEFLKISGVPTHCNLLFATQEEARNTPRGDLRLAFCRDCGHVFNLAFDAEAMHYTQQYENSLHFSPRFQDYARSLAENLVACYDLHNKDVIEIGCGQGDFLALLCDLGGNRGVGFDPSLRPEQVENTRPQRISFIRDFYSERYAEYEADFICCRQVLEHLADPRGFLQNIRRALDDHRQTIAFFEVPNVNFTLTELGIWDLIYEHCSYFSAPSLTRLFADCGFEVLACASVYAGQYLCLEARLAQKGRRGFGEKEESLEQMAEAVAKFTERYHAKIKTWNTELERIERAGQRAVVWGAGSKGVMFLNVLRARNAVAYVVDLNPRKHGKHIAGAGQKIVAPEALPEIRPEVILVMNPIYLHEIRGQVEGMNLSCDFRSV